MSGICVVHCKTALEQHDFEHVNECELNLEHDDEQLEINFPQAVSLDEHIDWQDLLACSCVRFSK